jgi:hypothetical protein
MAVCLLYETEKIWLYNNIVNCPIQDLSADIEHAT